MVVRPPGLEDAESLARASRDAPTSSRSSTSAGAARISPGSQFRAHRSHGVGGRLLAAVEEWAREHGAVEFYERNGCERQAVILRKALD